MLGEMGYGGFGMNTVPGALQPSIGMMPRKGESADDGLCRVSRVLQQSMFTADDLREHLTFKLIDFDDIRGFDDDFAWKRPETFTLLTIPIAMRMSLPMPAALDQEGGLHAWHKFAMRIEVCQLYLWTVHGFRAFAADLASGDRMMRLFQGVRKIKGGAKTVQELMRATYDQLPRQVEAMTDGAGPVLAYFRAAYREFDAEIGLELGLDDGGEQPQDLYGYVVDHPPPTARATPPFFEALQGRTPFSKVYFAATEREDGTLSVDGSAYYMDYAFTCKNGDFEMGGEEDTALKRAFLGTYWAFLRNAVAWCVHLKVVYSDWKLQNLGIAKLAFPLHMSTVVTARVDDELEVPELVVRGPAEFARLLVKKELQKAPELGKTAIHLVRTEDVTRWLQVEAAGAQQYRLSLHKGRASKELGVYAVLGRPEQPGGDETVGRIGELLFSGASHSTFTVLALPTLGEPGMFRQGFIAAYLADVYGNQGMGAKMEGPKALIVIDHLQRAG